MFNHIHLLLETGKTPLSKILQGIQFRYTQYHNRRYRMVGHLFQGRYKAILCDRDAYLVELVRYIHLNPARLKIPQDLVDYRWSSHHAYLGQSGPVSVDTALVMGQLGNSTRQARYNYRKFIEDGLRLGHQQRYYETIDQRFLGDEKFVQQIAERAPEREIKPHGAKIPFDTLLHAIAQVNSSGVEDLTAPQRRRAWGKPRAQLAYLAREWCAMNTIEIARRLNRDPSMVSRLCASYEAVRDLTTEKKITAVVKK
jgi:putative transposase